MPDTPNDAVYDHVWRSRTHLIDRAGQRLRVLVVGALNSALVEFQDGHQCVTSCFGYRRLGASAGLPLAQAERG